MAQRFSRTIPVLTLTALLALTLTRCALFGPSESFDRSGEYQVNVPDGWKTTDRGEADRAYATPGGAIATLTSSCVRPTEATLEQLTRHLLFGLRQQKVLEKQSITVGGQPALRTRLEAKLENKPVHLEVIVGRNGICVFDFSLLSPKAPTPGDRQAFQQFVASFRLGKGRP